jgi:hypothetical protein
MKRGRKPQAQRMAAKGPDLSPCHRTPSRLLNVANQDRGAGVESLACLRLSSFFNLARPGRPNLSETTKGPTTCNLVELRGHALKNYGVTDMGKHGIATARNKSDRHNSLFDREVNQFSAAAKSVHLHHLVLMEFDSSRRNRKLARNLLRRASFCEQLKNLSLA